MNVCFLRSVRFLLLVGFLRRRFLFCLVIIIGWRVQYGFWVILVVGVMVVGGMGWQGFWWSLVYNREQVYIKYCLQGWIIFCLVFLGLFLWLLCCLLCMLCCSWGFQCFLCSMFICCIFFSLLGFFNIVGFMLVLFCYS